GELGVEPPPEPLVEFLRAVDIRDGDDDDLELHVVAADLLCAHRGLLTCVSACACERFECEVRTELTAWSALRPGRPLLHSSVRRRSIRRRTKAAVSTSTATRALGLRPLRPRRSTTVRPRESSDEHSTSTFRYSVVRSPGRTSSATATASCTGYPSGYHGYRRYGGNASRIAATTAPARPRPRSSSSSAGLTIARYVTSRPTMVRSIPLEKKRRRDSGST